MSTAFEVDSNIANIFSSQVPIVEGTYDLTPDQVLIDQAEHESEVRSYPRRLPIAIKQAFGCLVEDTRGQIFLDCLAGAGTLALGYNHPEINQALKEQLDSGLPYQTLDIATSAKTTFIQSVKSFLPQELSENSVIQFCGPSGADAVEAAIKLAKQTTGRNTMFAFRGAYHGMTNGTMGMMGNLGTKARRTGLMSDVHFMPFPYNLRCPFGLGGDEGAKASIRYIDRLLNDDESGIMKPAAIIVEPVQGEGGVVPAPAFWLRELRRICDEHGILLIFDEIQCGIGKTGYNFAFEESGIVPDILCLSKAIGGGLPMSLLVINKQHDTWKPGEHTGTFRGNQLAMVSGAKALEIIQRDNLVEHANIAGQYLRYGLESIQKRVNCIAEVRGKGLMLGVEIKNPDGELNKFGEPQADSELTLSIQRAALERGLIVEKGGREGAVIRFLPPLIISFEQIDFALRVFEDAILAAGGSHIETQPQDEWKKHFIHTGEMGSNEFASVMNHTTTAMKSVFEQVTAPYSGVDPKALEAAIHDVDLDNGNAPLKSVIDDAADLVAKNAIFTQHPDCIAHLHTPPLMPAIAAEAMIAALNQSMDSWDQASSATYVEQKVVNWLCDKYELGEKADGIFTSGGTQSNQMGLMLARDWIADKLSAHSIQKLGLPEYADKLRIVCSKKSHFTVQKSASWMGLGEKAVMTVDANADGTMDVTKLDEVLNQAKAEGLIPFAIVGTAGTTDHGAIDDLDFIADIAAKHDMWMHVDGAYGGALILSSQKARLKGCERAHSISVDFHKLFYQTISCGALLVNDKSNFKFLLHHADYLNREHDELPNLVDKSIATTKRFDALKVFMTMQSVGPKALGDMYDHLLEQTLEVADMIRDNKHFELLAEPSLSTVLFRATHESADLDELNKTLRLEALTRGIAVLGETIVDDKTALKFTILNPCLTTADFESLLSKINTLAAELV
ncbi:MULTISPECIES: pyridoxal phosphate-dependent class III aminotransferase [Vibrio]|uniref:Aminotransferase class III-fold pyridoxal phosphate-dependent enzyme n=2 Tax=Vibrio harveyi group TaxID=717610 RepID=A0A7Y4B6J9_VIBAL|nr:MULTISPECIES: pyridoxal phosphate-dependent class III aminotransferase [Vibrio]EGQ9762735.1 aminotransferase class III-fold pyridoxal phosphate-dependent enzyme [Vibrio alginolyticus]EGR1563284.1 aminotransferase class III-fold pyridoxal phosphate-dependent enzyme [Vibrio alginolyticus]EHI5140979.1 diaminobutyrate--2-oxoglutarate transaminase family protein [Vibrio alginolyticus]EJR0951674.1 pyridoxal phosphate-dependent class III aminotransferase [Vibrio alginolyticus]EKA3118556.1 pyridoxa